MPQARALRITTISGACRRTPEEYIKNVGCTALERKKWRQRSRTCAAPLVLHRRFRRWRINFSGFRYSELPFPKITYCISRSYGSHPAPGRAGHSSNECNDVKSNSDLSLNLCERWIIQSFIGKIIFSFRSLVSILVRHISCIRITIVGCDAWELINYLGNGISQKNVLHSRGSILFKESLNESYYSIKSLHQISINLAPHFNMKLPSLQQVVTMTALFLFSSAAAQAYCGDCDPYPGSIGKSKSIYTKSACQPFTNSIIRAHNGVTACVATGKCVPREDVCASKRHRRYLKPQPKPRDRYLGTNTWLRKYGGVRNCIV